MQNRKVVTATTDRSVGGYGITPSSDVVYFTAEDAGLEKIYEVPAAGGEVKLVVDPKSYVYFQGTELDFVSSMMGHGFKFNNPNVKGSCGCGESVQF